MALYPEGTAPLPLDDPQNGAGIAGRTPADAELTL